MSTSAMNLPADAIAIVGIAGRFPGAADVDALWEMLVAGREGLAPLSEAELRAAGLGEVELADKNFVRVSGGIADYDRFDAEFFGLNPREAEILDPQHRVFFECAWSALENAGIDPARGGGSVGVFAGASLNTYLLFNVAPNRELVASVGVFGAAIASDKDALTQRLAYALDLRGPAVTVQTACSTSLVAAQLACQSLQNFQCDTALAGGVSVKVPHATGYVYTEGGVASPDGHCRPFDAAARGTVPASGCGVVVLRRLEDALADGDEIIAVIRGAAVNNDGANKVGFTAPGASGQAAVIALALAAAEVTPASIGLVEAHGTATPLGDPIEVAALAEVFGGAGGAARCALGSVKSNLGHLDAAAGVAGLIKAALAVRAGVVPATLHFTAPNPEAGLAGTPFFVNVQTVAWPVAGGRRRAGVSSFGIGGTNAHVVLEQAPERVETAGAVGVQWLPVSARNAAALARVSERLAAWLDANPEGNLADVARTLQRGRRGFAARRVVRATNAREAATAFREINGVVPADAPAGVKNWLASTESVWPEELTAAGHTVALPTYAFERTRHWVEAPVVAATEAGAQKFEKRDVSEWIYRAAWRRGVTRQSEPLNVVTWRRGDAAVAGERVVMDFVGCDAVEAVAALRAQASLGGKREIVALVDGVLAVEGGDVTAPELAAVIGFGAALAQEWPTLRFRVLDVGGLVGDERVAAVGAEFGAPTDEAVVARRGGRRWVRGWDAVPVAAGGGWRDGGVYLIAGGFGRLGLALADELARLGRVRLVLVGRRGASGVEARVRAIEATGSEVLVVAADVADEAGMRAAVVSAEARWGAVHGVIHAAGVTGAESVRAAAETDETVRAAQWRPKVEGWRALDAALAERAMDFRVAISSLAAVVGGPGLGAYAAANAALDALAEQSAARTDGTGWISVAWGGDGAGIDGATGAEVLLRLITRGEPGMWAVAMTDLRVWLRKTSAPAAVVMPVAVTRAEAERALAEIWREAVGAEPATWEQNFFEAGGDSLAAVQVVARINRRFGTELTVAAFLDQPTVAAVAARVARAETPVEAPVARERRGARRRERHDGGGA